MPKGRPSKRKRSGAMPKTKKRFRKRKTVKRQRAVKMFPKKQLVELTYCDEVLIPNVDAGSAPYKFRLNSIFDPDLTVGGHQPRGHDQWAAIYNKYCVVGATVRVEPLMGSTAATNIAATLYGYLDDDLTSDNYTVQQLIELNLPKSSHKFIEIGQSSRAPRGYSSKSPIMNFKVGMKKFFGLTNKTQVITARGIGMGDDAPDSPLVANFGTNPKDTCYLKLHTRSTASLGTQTLFCRVTIKYLVVCHDPKEIGGS